MTLNSSTLRLDLKCGKGSISKGEKCSKGPAISKTQAITAGAALTAVGVAGLALSQRRRPPRVVKVSRPSGTNTSGSPSPDPWDAPFTPRPPKPSSPPRPESPRVLPGDRTTRQLTGLTPRGLIPPGKPPKSKTQRMRENTAAAQTQARAAIAQTGREEVRRIAQIGNTMATTGEAAGMTVKTTLRELRLRAEAARRRFEPGYRQVSTATPEPPAQLAPSNSPELNLPFNPTPQRPRETVPINSRTGQPRRRRAQGFGRSDSPWAIGFGI